MLRDDRSTVVGVNALFPSLQMRGGDGTYSAAGRAAGRTWR
jgi:hypothetical protein